MEHIEIPPEVDSWLDDLCDRLLEFMRKQEGGNGDDVELPDDDDP